MAQFVKDPDWLNWLPNPVKPSFVVPYGAVDAHCHVFGPGERFPFAPERKYTPCDASVEQLWALRDHLGFARNVLVQASCHGADNRALVDALKRSQGMARGVATVKPDIDSQELDELHEAGVRAVRFNFVKRLVEPPSFDTLQSIVAKISLYNWHIVLYFEAQDLSEYYDFFTSLPTTVVVDHIGRPDVTKAVDGEEFELFIKLLAENDNFWSKVSCPERLSKTGPNGYDDVVPFAKLIVEMFSDQVLWGTDWPHPNMKTHMPDDGELVNFIPKIAPNAGLQKKLLVDNPMRLYWSD